MTTASEAIAAHNTAMQGFLGEMATSIDGVKGDVERQAELIRQLQENPGPISPEDQAILDELQSLTSSLAVKVKAVDDMTPPPAPTV